MSLQRKALTIIIGTFLLLLVSLVLVAELILIKRFEQLEEREAQANMERVRNAVAEQFAFLEAKAADWLAWDDAYQFVQDGNEDFRSANLFDANGANMKVNYLIYFNRRDEILGSFGWDLDREEPLPLNDEIKEFLAPESYFLKYSSPEDMKRGFVMFKNGPAFVVGGPVVTGEKKGPIMGRIVLIKFLTPSELERLSKVTKLALELRSWQEVGRLNDEWSQAHSLDRERPIQLTARDESLLQGYTLFYDWADRPSWVMQVNLDRDIKRYGKQTIEVLLMAIGVFSLFFAVALLLLLQSQVLRRVIELSRHVRSIGVDGTLGKRVKVEGQDEITFLSKSINRMLDALDEHSGSMQAILQHVPTGLLRCNASGAILRGYSHSCLELLQCDTVNSGEPNLEGKLIWQALGLSERDGAHFRGVYEQLFETSFLADELVINLPKVLKVGERTLQIKVQAIRKSDGELESMLFSFTDISELVQAEHERALNLALVRILRNLGRFRSLAERILTPIDRDAASVGTAVSWQDFYMQRMRDLHTWKGELATFGLKDLVALIHDLESRAPGMDALKEGMASLQQAFREFLAEHERVLGIKGQDLKTHMISIPEHKLLALRQTVEGKAAPNVVRAVDELLSDLMYEEAGKVFHFLQDGAQELAFRLGKSVRFVLRGEDVRLPLHYREVYNVLPHLIRNALDHGLESVGERGNKAPTGTVEMEAAVEEGHFLIRFKDDGRGVDLEKVRQVALSQAWLHEEEWELLSESERLMLIFRHGFSTRLQVSHVSGRGVGLDAVLQTVRRYEGEVRVESFPQKGTIFTILLPREQAQKLVA